MAAEPRARSERGAVLVLAGLVALHLWLRIDALPGPWGADALRYLAAGLDAEGPGSDPRTRRALFLWLIDAANDLFGASPTVSSLPGVLGSALVLPLTWAALRRRVGGWWALLPAALWCCLGVDLEETRELSPDALLAPFGAAAAWGLARLEDRELSWELFTAALLGVVLGLGFLVKETFALTALAVVVAALIGGRSRSWLWTAGALVLVAGLGEFVLGARLLNASADMARVAAPVGTDEPGFLRRVTVGVPLLLLTASLAFGRLFVVLLPALASLPSRAWRRDSVSLAAVLAVLAFMWTPVSLERWVLLPADHARYLLGALPLVLVAATTALVERPAGRVDRIAWWLGALAAVPFVIGSGVTGVVAGVGVVAAAALRVPRLESRRRALATSVAIACIASLPSDGLGVPGPLLGVAVVLTWLPRELDRRATAALLGATLLLTVVAVRGRFRPDLTWRVHEYVPPGATLYADPVAARRALLGARLGDAPLQVEVLGVQDSLPAAEPSRRLLLRRVRLRGPSQLDVLERSGWSEAADLGDSVLFAPRSDRDRAPQSD